MLKNTSLTLEIRRPKVYDLANNRAFSINQTLIEKPKTLIYNNNKFLSTVYIPLTLTIGAFVTSRPNIGTC
jgi:hypothetical protein